ncbi:hypothetical protein [Paractinoplanes deccanensis]|uniref:hypothetical protein n=1 Tax=Paractinoplanes deccanensis TaxID=113561 RepID=UPI001943FB9B|nr:hypothetical protein [Actinoplanes deccanensis]
MELLVDAQRVTPGLAMVAAALMVAAERITLRREVAGGRPITHRGQLRSTEERQLSHADILSGRHRRMSVMDHAKMLRTSTMATVHQMDLRHAVKP